MEFFKTTTKIDFMRQRKWAAIFSITLFILSLGSLFFHGLNLGLDFTGGLQVQVHYSQSVNLEQVRNELTQVGFNNAVVQSYGTSQDVMVKVQPRDGVTQQQITDKVTKALAGAKVEQVDYIGPQVGKALVTNGILAIIISLLATMAYIALRFEYRFAVSAAIALVHDPVLILGIFSFFHLEFNLITLAAVLTLLGYSLNDTVVVYDRARENFRKVRKGTSLEIMNLSVNQ
ncbi:MAG: protein translocase subunit SecF, partial [Gammaproteobacteria bacterium]|nr:protein translocase subunit SecF [Gammaproteobacteria bacterium]